MRYREPILERVPFIIRHSLFNRIPIITRVPVNCDRNSFAIESGGYVNCRLCNSNTDCSGYTYHFVDSDDLSVVDDCKKFVILNADGKTIDELISIIEKIEISGKYIRMLVSEPISNDVIMALAYSPYNVIQFNINLVQHNNLSDSVFFSNKCGLLVSMYMSPIIPIVVKVSKVLSIIDYYGLVVDYFCLKFFKTVNNCDYLDEFVDINHTLIPNRFLEISEGYLICSKIYKDKFVDMVNAYAKPRKVNIVLCDDNKCY